MFKSYLLSVVMAWLYILSFISIHSILLFYELGFLKVLDRFSQNYLG